MPEAVNHSINYELSRTPEPLAEDLDHRLASAAVKKYWTKRNPSGMLNSAWNYVEIALNSELTKPAASEEHLHTSQLLAAMVISDSKTNQDTFLSALTLSTYIPMFNKRAFEVEPGGEDCENIYRSLGQALNYAKPLDSDTPVQWRMTEIGVLALSARSRQPRLLMYPTSPREETSDIQALNHDSYFFDNRIKIPIQQKLLPTQKIYDEGIKILILEELLDRALKKNRDFEKKSLSDKVNYLLSLIIIETSGMQLDRDEIAFLNTMTEGVVAHYFSTSSLEEKIAA